MCIRNRIKVLDAVDFHDAERKVNRFLETDPDIAQLVTISYRLEYNKVILEYYVFGSSSNNNNNNNNNDNNDNNDSNFKPLTYYDYWTQVFRYYFPYY